jgi:hypothetical protein
MTETLTLQVPPSPAYAGVLRYVTATLATQAEFTLDEVEDARLAIDEALNFVLPHTAEPITFVLTVAGQTLSASMTASTELDQLPSTNTFGWIVLQSLTHMIRPTLLDQQLRIDMQLEHRSSVDA